MSEQENLKIVQGVFEAFSHGDVPGMLRLLAYDIEWIIAGPSEVPYFGERRGHNGVTDFLSKLGSTVEFAQFAPQEFVAKDDKVFVFGIERGRVKETGKNFENPWAMVFTLRDGHVARFRSYEDTAAVAEAFRG
jgi:ketosteroid isomerase-like protein